MTRDPAASASLDELVRMNVAGDIEAVADELAFMQGRLSFDGDEHLFDDLGDEVARLRRIAAGVRGEGAPTRKGGDGRPSGCTPSPHPPEEG